MEVKFTDEAKEEFQRTWDKAQEKHESGLKILGLQITGSSESRIAGKENASGETHYIKGDGLKIKPAKEM